MIEIFIFHFYLMELSPYWNSILCSRSISQESLFTYITHTCVRTRACALARKEGRDRKVYRNEIEREGRETPWDRNFSRTLLSLEITCVNLIQSKRGRMYLSECAPAVLHMTHRDWSRKNSRYYVKHINPSREGEMWNRKYPTFSIFSVSLRNLWPLRQYKTFKS